MNDAVRPTSPDNTPPPTVDLDVYGVVERRRRKGRRHVSKVMRPELNTSPPRKEGRIGQCEAQLEGGDVAP